MNKNLEEKLKKNLKSYPDFPEKGILFRDLLTISKDPSLFKDLLEEISKLDSIRNSDAIVAIDARGFIFGAPLALILEKPIIFARKPGKLPGDLISNSYDLEYGSNTLCLQKEALKDFDKFCIIDDLLATGGTAACVENLILDQNKFVTGLVVVVELKDLNGSRKLKSKVNSIVSF